MADSETGVPPPDLGLLFATNAVDLEARRVFVDRVPEQQAFDQAVAAHLAMVRDLRFDSQDVVAPRRNMLVFYGVGGVGKTSLSRELERRHSAGGPSAVADWPAWQRGFKTSVTARVDLASEAGLDLERVLVGVRVAVAALRRPMYAFDLAFKRYWERLHPNESLDEYIRKDTRISRVAEGLDVPEQISDGLKDIATALGGTSMVVTLATRLATLVGSEVKRGIVVRHAVQACSRLPSLLSSEPDLESLSYYSHLLSWDLARVAGQGRRDFHVAVFLDTFEDVLHGEQRRFERLMNRLVWLMPNVLFVVSSRNRIDWGDPNVAGRLDFAGPGRWPGLELGTVGEPTQHLVGDLSDSDADKFLRLRLRRGGDAAIPEPVRERIVRASGGYPLYLDVATLHYLQMVAADTAPDPDDFPTGFPELVTRVLRDLTSEERRLLRILSLLDSFDARLAAAIAQLPSEAAAIGLTNRAFVDVDETAPFPYTIHRLLREQVRQSDSGPDAFSPGDWARYAARAFEELGARFDGVGAAGDRALVISVLNQALRLADEFDLPLGWTADAAYAYVQDTLWEETLRPLVRVPSATPAAALAEALHAIANRQVDGREQAAATLTGLLSTGLLTGEAWDLAAYYAAESLREVGAGDQSDELLSTLISRDSRIAELAVKGMVHRLRRQGRFADALQLIGSRPETGMWIQLKGTLYWSQGMLVEAKAAYLVARDRLLSDGLPGQAAEASGCLAFVCGLIAAQRDDTDLVVKALADLESSRNTWARLMAKLGDALLTASGGDNTAAELSAIEGGGRAAGLSSILAYARFLACFNAALSSDETRLLAARAALNELGAADFRWLDEVVGFWLDAPEPDDGDASDWLGGAAVARDRWRQLAQDRRARLESALVAQPAEDGLTS